MIYDEFYFFVIKTGLISNNFPFVAIKWMYVL